MNAFKVEAQSPAAARSKRVVLDARVVSGTGGGPDKTILNSPRFLAKAGYHNICAYLHPPLDPGYEAIVKNADVLKAPLISIPDRGPFDWKVIQRLAGICREERVEIWHGHDYKSNALGLLLKPFWPMRLVTTVHGWVKHTRRTPLYYGIDRFCLKHYEVVVCVSNDLYEECLDLGTPKDRCILIENGIDVEQFRRCRSTAEAKQSLGIPADRLLIGAVGRLSEEKGFDLLIRAVDRLIASGCDVELRIVGEGDQHAHLDALIRELRRENRIRLAGFQRDTIPVFEAMDVFALSSLREGLPNVVLEAMAMKTPVVATRIAGIPRVIRHQKNGLLVDPGSVEALVEALERLIHAPELRIELAEAGRETIENHHGFAARMDKIRVVYDGLFAGPSSTATPNECLERI